MSEIETHKGKLVPMTLSGVTLEERCEAACKELGIEMADYYDTWEECLKDVGYKKVYIQDDGVIYKIEDTEVDSYGFVEGSKNEDGSIDYFISWYNGGASMDEVLDDVIEKVSKE